MKKAFVHIGFPKTGTSTLQEFLFPNIKEISFIGTPHHGKKTKLVRDIRDLENLKGATFPTLRIDQNVLISDESLMPAQEFHPDRKYAKRQCERIAENIREALNSHGFEAQIIFVIRKQDSMVKSQFSQFYPWYHNHKEIAVFEKYVKHFLSDDISSSLKPALDYYEVYKIYEKVFSAENVYVLVFEELVNDQNSYYSKWCRILGIDEATYVELASGKSINSKSHAGTYSKVQGTSLLAQLSKVKRRFLPNVNFRTGDSLKKVLNSVIIDSNQSVAKSIALTEWEGKEILKRYEESNRKISIEKNLNLEEYGYFQ